MGSLDLPREMLVEREQQLTIGIVTQDHCVRIFLHRAQDIDLLFAF